MISSIINFVMKRETLSYNLNKGFFNILGLYLRYYKIPISFAVVSLVLLHFFQVKTTLLIQVISNQGGSVSISSIIIQLTLLSIGIFVFRTFSRCLFFFPARLQQTDLRRKFFNMLSQCDPILWKNNTIGKLFEIVITDFEELRVFFGFMFLQIANLLISILIILPAMLKIHPQLIQSLIPLGVCFMLFSLSLSWTSKIAEKGKLEHDVLQQMLLEFYDAKRTLNVFSKEKSALNEFNKQSRSELNYFLVTNLIRSFTRPLLMLGSGLSVVLAGYIIHKNNLPLSYLVIYSTFIFLLYEPLGYLSWMGVILTDSKISWNRINTLTQSLSAPMENKISVSVNEKSKGLDCYLPEKMNMSLSLGAKYMLCGPTSGGKSFILESLHRELIKLNYSSVLVPQDPFLFDHTLKDNLLLGLEFDKDLKNSAMELLELFELQNLHDVKAEIFDLHVGEKGKKLSGGQVKRLHMIRSLLFHYDFILWDDPFSAIDVLTEKRILTKLLHSKHPSLVDKTFILSSHRISTLNFFTDIIFVSKEKVYSGNKSDQYFEQKLKSFFQKSEEIK